MMFLIPQTGPTRQSPIWRIGARRQRLKDFHPQGIRQLEAHKAMSVAVHSYCYTSVVYRLTTAAVQTADQPASLPSIVVAEETVLELMDSIYL